MMSGLQKQRKNKTVFSIAIDDSAHFECALKARLHIGEATRRFLFVSLCRVQRFARVSVK